MSKVNSILEGLNVIKDSVDTPKLKVGDIIKVDKGVKISPLGRTKWFVVGRTLDGKYSISSGVTVTKTFSVKSKELDVFVRTASELSPGLRIIGFSQDTYERFKDNDEYIKDELRVKKTRDLLRNPKSLGKIKY